MPTLNPAQTDSNRGHLIAWSVQKNYCEFNGSVLTCYVPIYSYYYSLGPGENIAKAPTVIPAATAASYPGAAGTSLTDVAEAAQRDYWKTVILILACTNLGIAIASLPNNDYLPNRPAEIWRYQAPSALDSANSSDASAASNHAAGTDLDPPSAPVPESSPLNEPTQTPNQPLPAETLPPTDQKHSVAAQEKNTALPQKTPAKPKPKTAPSPGSSAKKPSAAVIREELSRITEITTADLATLEPVIMECTAYTHTGSRTATGVMPRYGVVAVDPKVIPLGSQLYVSGYGPAIAADTGGLIKGNIIDIFLDSEAACRQWGRRKIPVYILRKGA